MILIDSDVLIWHARGHAGAKARLAQINPWRISTITYLKLLTANTRHFAAIEGIGLERFDLD